MSIKYKIALLFAILVTLFVAIVSISVYFVSAKERQKTFNTRLKNRALGTAKVYAGILDSNFSVLQRMDATAMTSLFNKSIAIIGYNDSYVYSFSDNAGDSLYLNKNDIERTKIDNEYFFVYNNKKAVAIHHADSASDFIVAVAASDPDGRQFIAQLKSTLLITVLLATLFSFLAGLVFAKSLISPIKRITGEVNLITSNSLTQHIKVNNARDELTKLAQTFNNLLDRLQDSFAIQRRFISNASHELSTPLTSISSQLEVAMQKNRTPQEYKDVMQSVYEDIKELQQLTRSLLDIAKTGSEGSIDLTEVRLDEVLFKVVSDVQKQNREYKVDLNFEIFPDNDQLLTVFGNANLLYIALKNIVENGCKYADNQQTVITILVDKTNIIIKVSNKGDVISASDIQNIFQPFFRAEGAQSKPGFGLGLTLAKRILSLHKGTIVAESNLEEGTVFTIHLDNILALH